MAGGAAVGMGFPPHLGRPFRYIDRRLGAGGVTSKKYKLCYKVCVPPHHILSPFSLPHFHHFPPWKRPPAFAISTSMLGGAYCGPTLASSSRIAATTLAAPSWSM
jgi:hypothetical protein